MGGPLPVRGPEGRSPAPPIGRAVDRPVSWWSAGAVFLANAGLSAAEDQWILAVLHGLTCVWAVVAGVTAGSLRARHPAGDRSGGATDTGGP